MSVCEQVCASVSVGKKRGLDLLGLELQMIVSLPLWVLGTELGSSGCWGLNSGPPEEQGVLLFTFQPLLALSLTFSLATFENRLIIKWFLIRYGMVYLYHGV